MYEFRDSVPSVKVDLPNGIYVFPNMSAVGKTFLVKTLSSLRRDCKRTVDVRLTGLCDITFTPEEIEVTSL